MSAALSEAELRVQAVKRDNSEILDLSGLRLRSVPESLAGLKHLRELRLNDNRLTDLPESLRNLTKLTHLNLEENRLAKVPEWIGGLSELTWLDLSDNQIIEVPAWISNFALTHLGIGRCYLTAAPEWVASLTGLTELCLSDNWLTSVPEWLGDLTELSTLRLDTNRLKTLPASLARLTKLTRLDLDWNQLAEVPEWIRQLAALTSLDLGNNQFTHLPDWLGSLSALTRVDLGNCQLTEVPGWVANLTGLTELCLSDNWLTEVPEWLGNLAELTKLRLDSNRLCALPSSLASLTKLTRLDLDRNRVTVVPDWIDRLTDLTWLDLDGNKIDELPAWLGDLNGLEYLSLSDSNLTNIPDWLANLAGLTELNVSNNQLTEVSDSVRGLRMLRTLHLDNNNIAALPEWLSELTRITVLYLSGNQLGELPRCIRGLASLQRLNLSNNKLSTVPDWLSDFTKLSDLYLYRNEITELPEALANLTNISRIDLSDNRFTAIPGWLRDSTDLTYLCVDNNQLDGLPDWIGELAQLTNLSIRNCQLTQVPIWLESLTKLTFLDLSSNKLISLPESIRNLTGLQTLNLQDNSLTTIPAWLGDLTGLTGLYLDENELGELPESIAHLTGLKWLGLSRTGLARLPDWIGNMTAMTILDISNNELTELPESLKNLTRLSYLYLQNNKISELPPWIGVFRGLTRLDLPGNSLTAIPQGIAELTGIEYLDLSFNKLPSIPPDLAQLTGLRELDLSNNVLTEVPDWLLDLPSLGVLSLAGNPALTSPPPEIAASGTESVLAFLLARREGATRQWVSKLLVVGEGGVGKTSLIKALLGSEHDPVEGTTHGIRVSDLSVDHPTQPDVQMRLSAWDFGGQQIYHATHQFFLTDRSLFLLLWNSRLGWEQGRLEYWLDIIKSRAPDSPVLLIATHAEASERPVDLPIDDLRYEYPQIAGSLVIDNQTRSGIEQVRGELARQAAALPLMGAEWPTTWLNAADAVKASPENHITPDQMWRLMSQADVTDPTQQRYIAVAMHQLGDILYYSDDPELEQTVVLRPEWVNEYISEVLDSKVVDEARGLLTHAEMSRLWSSLDRGMRDHFLGMMDKYEISFRVDGGPTGVVSLVVERLPWNPPSYEDDWDAMLATAGICEIKVLYQLNTMPPGIPTWFIARSHRFTTNTHWRTGALLRHPDGAHKAVVRAYPRRNTVELTVRGPAPAAFFSVLDDGFNRTLDRYPGLEIKRLVPCPCAAAGDNGCTELFDYADLQKRLLLDPPRHEIECHKSGELLNVPQLLLGLAPAERDATRAGIERLTSMFHGIVSDMADQGEYMQRMFLKILRLTQEAQEVRCPSVFTIIPVKSRRTGTTSEIRLYCEEPGAWHPLPGTAGRYEVNEPAEWLRKIRPHLSKLLTVLKHAAPLAGPVLGMTVAHVSERLQAEVNAMTELVDQIPELSRIPDPLDKDGRPEPGPVVHATTEADFRALESVLLKLDPDRTWGGLSRTVTPEELTLYLCREHSEAYRRAVRL